MAEWFTRFDPLPIDHSHGNLCAWRGILELYDITGKRAYLDRALAKWERAVQDGFVWSLGGVGECWYVFYHHDEGCSESDWLRFNLQLWQFTGQTRFLDMAERLLLNQYAANQCPNGGYGVREFDGEPTGPIGTHGEVGECNYCCSFHGPLGTAFPQILFGGRLGPGRLRQFPTRLCLYRQERRPRLARDGPHPVATQPAKETWTWNWRRLTGQNRPAPPFGCAGRIGRRASS